MMTMTILQTILQNPSLLSVLVVCLTGLRLVHILMNKIETDTNEVISCLIHDVEKLQAEDRLTEEKLAEVRSALKPFSELAAKIPSLEADIRKHTDKLSNIALAGRR
jgi:short subunit fatty acids transporter